MIRASNKLIRYPFSATYVSGLFEHWQKNPQSVPEGWRQYFSEQINGGVGVQGTTSLNPLDHAKQIQLLYRTYYMFRMFFVCGHQLADLDPLNLPHTKEYGRVKGSRPEMTLDSFGFKKEELDIPIYFGNKDQRSFIYPFMEAKEEWTIREIYDRLSQIYTKKYGVEYIHMVSTEQKHWVEQEMDRIAQWKPSKETQTATWQRLARVDLFNEFLKNRFTTSKRFGIEGTDTLIVGLEALVDQCVQNKVEHIIVGMAHRGRLSTLANVFKKPLEIIFAEFQNKYSKEIEESWGNIGDVKYHLGVTRDQQFPDGHHIRMTMLPNPSHLEAVNPVVQGKTRALQDICGNKQNCLGIIIHGDAAMAGQGVVYESLQLENLTGYSNEGVIHVVVNNQIGFTTTPIDSRSGLYCTDVAKAIDVPIIHVNADDPDLVEEIFKIAVRFRQQFKKDIVIDLIGYRRYGHNEQDQPAFTQPQMYEIINKQKPVFQLYDQQLRKNGVIADDFANTEIKKLNNILETAYKNIQKETFDKVHWVPKPWEKIQQVTKWGKVKDTGVALKDLLELNEKVNKLPAELTVHPQVKRIYEQRKQSIEQGKGIDFGTAEALAFGTLLHEGFSIRLSGQDCERGTFSQRHAVINDQKKDVKYYPLRNQIPTGGNNRFEVYNSPLSEYGVLGFEYGYSQSNPNVLTIWEGQFGDFANGAQIMIDNFITSGESKWNVPSGLVMMLPHGLDGQGPEHSSGRMERFLQLMDDDPNIVFQMKEQRIKRQILDSNFQVCVCSNPSNYFHSLRRQLRRDFRKPLILFNSKRLLKFSKATSDISLFLEGTRFHRLIPDTHEEIKPPKEISKVVICYGQVYYDILQKRQDTKRNDVAIIRVEQLAPFPYDHFRVVAQQYENAEFVFCQEEHQNSGAWQYLEPRIQNVLSLLHQQSKIKHQYLTFCGRRPSASTASGSPTVHKQELEKLLSILFQ
ncbi:unnamed protein product [Paramecium octaurelia]|uniref:2-oxoglutarate dehydrogenase, mitochondrial n=1 Tax=Paramecium octaurelia TaxID=43137 RepID=A0A8S1SJS5_PAROT|nr:unnamed protein product [Paramecium octaurelia]